MKEIKIFRMGDEIPNNAKFLSMDSETVIHQSRHIPGTNVTPESKKVIRTFLYEVPIKDEQAAVKKESSINEVLTMTRAVLDHLNNRTGRNYKAIGQNVTLVSARMGTNRATFKDFKTVIDNMCDAWLDDPKWSKYLRPSTLFKASKFDDYLNHKSENQEAADAFAELEEYIK